MYADALLLENPELAAAIDAVILAGRVCRFVQSARGGAGRIVKPDQSPVTIADFAAQALVARTLASRLGPVRLVGEETSVHLRSPQGRGNARACLQALDQSGCWPGVREDELLGAIDAGAHRADDAHTTLGGRFWTVDPIDGTKGFLRGQQYAVCLALIEQGRVIAGALCCPNLSIDHARPLDDPAPDGTCYFAAQGAGAYEGVLGHDPRSARRLVHRPWEPGRAPVLTEGVAPGHADLSKLARLCASCEPAGRTLKLDSQCKYAVVARGQADLYARFPSRPGASQNIWDHAPGVLLVVESGGVATDVRGRALDFGAADMSGVNTGVLAGDAALHAQLLPTARAL